MKSNSNNNISLICSIVVSVLLIIPILLIPAFGPIDDHRIYRLINLSWSEIWNEHIIEMIRSKRFILFGLIDEWFVANITNTATFFYWTLFSIALIGLIVLFYTTLRYTIFKKQIYWFLPFIFLSMAFTDNFYRLGPAEKYLMICIPFFICFFYKWLQSNKPIFFILILGVSILAIFQKEIIFTLFGAFAILYLLLQYFYTKIKLTKLDVKLIWLNIGILVSCFFFLFLYYILIFSKGNSNSGFGNIFGMSIFERISLAASFYIDYLFKVPIVTIFVPIILLIRFVFFKKYNNYFESIQRNELLPFYDALLLASLLFTFVVCLTGQGAFGRYLFPAMLFVIFPLIEYFAIFFSFYKIKWMKLFLLFFISYSLINSSIRGITWAIGFKVDAYVMEHTIQFISDYTKMNGPSNVFLADREPYHQAEYYMGYGAALKQFYHIPSNNFDLRALIIEDRDISIDWWSHNPKEKEYDFCNYSALQSLELKLPKKNDLLIISNMYFNNVERKAVDKVIVSRNLKLHKVFDESQKYFYYLNPLSVSVLCGKKPLYRKAFIHNDIFIAQ